MAKTAKGKRPVYFEDSQVDKLLAIVMALTGEVSVLRERLDTLERLLETKGILSISEIEAYQPDDSVAKEREQWRADYIARVLRVLQEELGSLNH
jgi:predicted  nucleic acid-binding Zn-ribbon protein